VTEADFDMSDNDFFAPPAFKPEEALLKLRRELRDLGLSERAGVFERKGQAIAKAAVDGALLQLALVKRPARTPEWVSKTVKDHAQLRDFVATLKKNLSGWSDGDE
jgi:hypothetical protein